MHAAQALSNVTITTKSGQWVDLVFTSKVFPMPVAEAAAAMPEAFNLVDPPRRDAFSSPNALDKPVWVAVRYHVVNPGPWLLYCHILMHSEGGMPFVILNGIDDWPRRWITMYSLTGRANALNETK